ncbi:MAG: hypothetical protein MK538_21235, partial [Planctomycetes bacterium]|nr:hypothetical protein [Planctomycetota bacterium]
DYAALTPGSTVELPPPGGFAVASCYALLFGAPLVGSYRWLLALIICGAAAGGAFVQKERPLAVALPVPEGAATLVREPYGSLLITDAHTVEALGAQRLAQAVIGAGETKVNRLVLLSTSTRGQESWRELRRRLSAEKSFVIAPSYRISTEKTSVKHRSQHCFVARAAIVRTPLELVSPDAAVNATCKREAGESPTRERLDGVAVLWIHHGRAALVPYRLDREHATRLLAQLDRFVIDLLLVRDLSDLGGMALEYCKRLRPRKIVLSRVRSTAAHRFVRWCQRHQIDVEIASTANGVGVDLQSFGNHRRSTH